MNYKELIGSGDKILPLTLLVFFIGLILNLINSSVFSVGGPPISLKIISVIFLIPGLIIWIWSVVLIIIKVPKKELITYGPYSLVKHPIYTSVAFLVLPWAGFLLNTWLGLLVGIVLYITSRRFAPQEEKLLEKNFGNVYRQYCKKVMIPWI